MALKFLNKKGWHTGSLRNIENVWKAEQKHDAEQKKLEELRKQIQEERERSEFRLLQEQAGLVPKQERLEFLYDSGLSVGKGSASSSGAGGGGGFKALEEALPTSKPAADASSKQSPSVPGALFEDKPHSANDAWRKLHSDPLLLIRQREQEALARIKNNPVQMARIRKSVEEKKEKDKPHDKRESHKHRNSSSTKHRKHSSRAEQSDSEDDTYKVDKRRKNGDYKSSQGHRDRKQPDSENESSDRENQKKRRQKEKYNHDGPDANRKNLDEGEYRRSHESHHRRQGVAPKLSEEERAARLREMQEDAEVHEEQRWKRLKKTEENDAREATRATISDGRKFLDAAHRSVYGAEKGGSSTIEESVRRRTHYLQGRSESEGNAFRR
ncbi:hypothetical protein SLEP1_g29196 [Rubroshorea leprosula]|uniref:CBF1-interacting co-repressor CIR N-terminal domain-containing protein n=1 Tax=Rubroshorea leprosula TaxID=152421 RepID=A0AAV5K2M3_9ROSI|nr:hypothetical protein SLEP1_g29196 [Rubroshorea leprosula]